MRNNSIITVIVTGVIAGALSSNISTEQLFPVVTAGLLCSSLGLLISIVLAGVYMQRLFTHGLPDPDHHLGMMVAVGPPSFVPLAYLRMSLAVPQVQHYAFFAGHAAAPDIVQVMALLISIAVWSMAVFFMLIATFAILGSIKGMRFQLTWYTTVFPNTGLVARCCILGSYCRAMESCGWRVCALVFCRGCGCLLLCRML
jgi:tellurite resistance protein TehA-like permease